MHDVTLKMNEALDSTRQRIRGAAVANTTAVHKKSAILPNSL
jgi:hypothetical protein